MSKNCRVTLKNDSINITPEIQKWLDETSDRLSEYMDTSEYKEKTQKYIDSYIESIIYGTSFSMDGEPIGRGEVFK